MWKGSLCILAPLIWIHCAGTPYTWATINPCKDDVKIFLQWQISLILASTLSIEGHLTDIRCIENLFQSSGPKTFSWEWCKIMPTSYRMAYGLTALELILFPMVYKENMKFRYMAFILLSMLTYLYISRIDNGYTSSIMPYYFI